eukprot:TRINITY_DN4527_c0_g1_i1.p1 TRINITY_DN4527_c0_g1~~TRINITY_DN4527_c0_g1_i1.p1  ORF type:complete len:340 (+),score=83.20 TRINITY_DN4527_c0_g1_i1:129-1148(+)
MCIRDRNILTHKAATPVIPPKFAGCNASALYSNTTCAQTCRTQANTTAWRPYPDDVLKRSASCRQCKHWDGEDTVFETLLKMHDGLPLDSVLDAGTGKTSLDWISKELRPKRWTAVTATDSTRALVSSPGMVKRMRDGDRVVVGNWENASLLQDETFDLVLVDHLIGSSEMYWPHGQDQLVDRMADKLSAHGRIYVIGMDPEPYPSRFEIPGQQGYHLYHPVHIFREVNNLLAACIAHAGHRATREFPLDWVTSAVEKHPKLKLDSAQAFPAVWGARALHVKLDVCEDKLKRDVEGRHLANGIKDKIKMLRKRIDSHPQFQSNGLCYGVEYLVSISRSK